MDMKATDKNRGTERICCYIVGLVIAAILYVFSLIDLYCLQKLCKETDIMANIISALILCVILTSLFFDILLQPETHKRSLYIVLQFIFTLLPFGLLEQYRTFDYPFVIFIPFVITLISICFLYKKLKKIEKINIKHIEYLKHYNVLLTTIFIIIRTTIDFIHSGKGTPFFLVYVTPLMLWQFFYNEIIIQRNE